MRCEAFHREREISFKGKALVNVSYILSAAILQNLLLDLSGLTVQSYANLTGTLEDLELHSYMCKTVALLKNEMSELLRNIFPLGHLQCIQIGKTKSACQPHDACSPLEKKITGGRCKGQHFNTLGPRVPLLKPSPLRRHRFMFIMLLAIVYKGIYFIRVLLLVGKYNNRGRSWNKEVSCKWNTPPLQNT